MFSRVILISREAYLPPHEQQMINGFIIYMFYNFLSLIINLGDASGGDTLLTIPNRVVKPSSADGTAPETGWESRSLPDIIL